MGLAAIFTATNTMLAAVAARTHEIGILLRDRLPARSRSSSRSCSRPSLLGLIGGLVGCLSRCRFNGVETGTMNFQTFTEMAFAFRVTPDGAR